jgi:hypothetical protein
MGVGMEPAVLEPRTDTVYCITVKQVHLVTPITISPGMSLLDRRTYEYSKQSGHSQQITTKYGIV